MNKIFYYKNILQIFEQRVVENPDKIIFANDEKSISYSDFIKEAKRIGTAIAKLNYHNHPIAIYMPKSIEALITMFAVLYSGNFYTIIDTEAPKDRVNLILQSLQPFMIISLDDLVAKVKENFQCKYIFSFTDLNRNSDDALLANVRKKMVSTDPVYAIFTSGSTGIPKGSIASHQNLISYISWYVNQFNIDENTIFGSQTPFYFSMSVSDIFATVVTGATFILIPKLYFSFPIKLVECLNKFKINTIYWVPSALAIVANLKLFDYAKPEYLTKVLFAGEVMPIKQLKYWLDHVDAYYANLFGPTETVDICTYYHVTNVDGMTSLPIGEGCDNTDALVLNDKNERCKIMEIGELVVRGPFVTMGYYNNFEKTNITFVRNPENSAYNELVYRTGDLVYVNENDELIYVGRKDFQIKHMGYRIELGEIEAAANQNEIIKSSVCLYDKDKDLIVLVYEGKISKDDLRAFLEKKVPKYMAPNVYIRIKAMIYNMNGKIDRAYLKEHYYSLPSI